MLFVDGAEHSIWRLDFLQTVDLLQWGGANVWLYSPRPAADGKILP
eukprot:COSAG02_NODE_7256_length_3094_cov_19.263773_8_plen_46_part_00